MNRLMMLVAASTVTMISCVAEQATESEEGANVVDIFDEAELAEHTSSLVVGGRYCVRGSSTGAYRNTRPAGPPECSGFGSTFPVNATLTGGTLLIISANCGNPAFVNGLSSGSYYMVRASSLAPC